MVSQEGKRLVGLTVIGCGVLANCIVQGLLEAEDPPYRYAIRLTARRTEHVAELRRRYAGRGFTVADDNGAPDLWKNPWRGGKTPVAHLVLICTQPEFTADVCDVLGGVNEEHGFDPAPVFVTMCPGITLERLEGLLPSGAAIVRTMPNTPVAVKQGATAIYANANATDAAIDQVKTLFQMVSPSVCLLPSEDMLDVAASVSGSSPAYFYVLLEALTNAGIARGLPPKLARELVSQSGLGSVILAKSTDRPLQQLVEDVCVPGGSTEKAVGCLVENDVSSIIQDAVDRSLHVNRSMHC